MKKLPFYILLFFGIVATVLSCQKIDDLSNADLEFEGDYATALLTANVRIDDIVGELDSNTTVELDADGLVHLIYRGKFTQRSTDDILAGIPQLPVPLTDTFVTLPYPSPAGMSLDFLILKTANINYSCRSNETEDVDLMVEIPELTDPVTGNTYKHFNVITFDGSAPSNGSGVMNLAGYKLQPNAGGNITIRYVATKADGTRVLLSNFFSLFQNFQASYAEGYLGNQVYDDLDSDTIIIDFFDRWISGGITFADPVININVENSFGFPVRSTFNTMGVWSEDGSITQLNSAALSAGIDFAYPTLPNEVGEVKETSFQIDKDNSNIVSLFSTRPIAIDYNLEALGNPDNDTNITGFITDSSFFSVNVYVDLPIHATANLFTISSDIEIENAIDEEYEYVDYLKLKIVTENRIPVEGALQFYFEDDMGNKLDSLFDVPLNQLLPDHKIMDAADTDATGASISTAYNEIEIDIPRDKFDSFLNMTNATLVTVLNNNPGTVVKFFGENDVDIKIGVKAGISQ
ncbi:MAG: hypothetical protein ACPG5P_01755 [Saprospiraceae bacterium]